MQKINLVPHIVFKIFKTLTTAHRTRPHAIHKLDLDDGNFFVEIKCTTSGNISTSYYKNFTI